MKSIPNQIQKILDEKYSLLLAIDGRCGCGKSSLGAELAECLDANLFHMDDFYLPFRQRVENWQEIPAGNMDLTRFLTEVLEPALNGQEILYRAFSCPQRRYLQEKRLPPKRVNIVEGSYSQHPFLADAYDVKLFVTAERSIQEARLQAREGDHYKAFEEIWIPMEENYFRHFSIENNADCIIRTDVTPPTWEWKNTEEE
ncbi:MAG: uridine kinase [Oscillospiraceae bacterium]|nr:uridine kinase [Oscillospiraceae bacterium]